MGSVSLRLFALCMLEPPKIDLFNLNFSEMSIKDQIHSSHVLSVLVALGIVLVAGGCSSSRAIPTPDSSEVSYRPPAIHKHTHEQLLRKQKQLFKESKQ